MLEFLTLENRQPYEMFKLKQVSAVAEKPRDALRNS